MKSDANDAIDDGDILPREHPSLVQELKAIDDARPDFPGEHLLVFGLGAWLLIAGMRGGTVFKRAAFTAVGTALIGRAASGTGGIARVARVLKKFS